jgi:hypothetical protein
LISSNVRGNDGCITLDQRRIAVRDSAAEVQHGNFVD